MKFSIVHEQPWNTVAAWLEKEAKANNMTVNGVRAVVDPHRCCAHKMPCCQSGYWYQFIQETKNRTRIYVFLGTPSALIDMMNVMHSAQLFERGEYMVIYVDMNTYSEKEATTYLWRPEQLSKSAACHHADAEEQFLKRARSLLVVVATAPLQERYENFTRRVREYNERDPFNFTTPKFFDTLNFQKFVSIYAANLYDSVKLYAGALERLLAERRTQVGNRSLNSEEVEQVAANGTSIINALKNFTYESVTGAQMKLDHNGDSEGNFTVVSLQPYNLTVQNFSCRYHLLPVGYFQRHGDHLEYKLLSPNHKIHWPGDLKPEDEPSCGFDNESCQKHDTQFKSIIAAAVLAVVLFCAAVITVSIYRKWKIEQEIEGLLWKIDPDEIHHYFGNDIVSSPSKVSARRRRAETPACGH